MARKTKTSPKEVKTPELPKVSIFGKRPSMFSGSNVLNRGRAPKSFIPPTARVTQNKGSGGK